jgi:hypothetical protein
MSAPCQQCGGRAQLVLCRRCIAQLEQMLTDLCWLLGELSTTARRQDRLSVGAARLVEHPSPANMSAVDLLRSMDTQLRWIIGQVHQATLPAAAEPRLLAWWLCQHLDELARWDQAAAVYKHIQDLVGGHGPGPIHDVINRDDRRFAGQCPSCAALCYARHEDVYTVCTAVTDYTARGEPILCGTPINVERNRADTIAAHDVMTERMLLGTLDNLDEHVPRVTFYGWVSSGRLPIAGYLSATGIVAHRTAHNEPRLYSLTRARALRWREQIPHISCVSPNWEAYTARWADDVMPRSGSPVRVESIEYPESVER